jgi:hypothetical protein
MHTSLSNLNKSTEVFLFIVALLFRDSDMNIDEVALLREEEAEVSSIIFGAMFSPFLLFRQNDWRKRVEELQFGGAVVGSRSRKLDESHEPPFSADDSDELDEVEPGSPLAPASPEADDDDDDDDDDDVDMHGI